MSHLFGAYASLVSQTVFLTCISFAVVDDFRRNKVADKFFTSDLLFNTAKLEREIQPYVDEVCAHVAIKFDFC